MSLAALIRKRGNSKPANANPANAANDGQTEAGTLATLAGLALARQETCWRWTMHYPNGPVEVQFLPTVTHAEALAKCPGAIAAEPMPESANRKPTEAEAAELSRLTDLVYVDEADRAEALAHALSDPEAALACYRAMVGNKSSGH